MNTGTHPALSVSTSGATEQYKLDGWGQYKSKEERKEYEQGEVTRREVGSGDWPSRVEVH